jgi:YVTN family beta-propeller protein
MGKLFHTQEKSSRSYDEEVRYLALLPLVVGGLAIAQSYTSPAGLRQALRREGASILPGGRVIGPLGTEYVTGPGPFGLAVSPSGKSVFTANAGPWRYTLTVLERDKSNQWNAREIESRAAPSPDPFGMEKRPAWRGVSIGAAFSSDRSMWVSEGNSGRVALYESNDDPRHSIDLNQGGFTASYTGDLACDVELGLLYIADQANSRVAVVDTKSRQILGSARAGRLPFALGLSPDKQHLYVANVGVLSYQMVPNTDPANTHIPGLRFPPVERAHEDEEGNSLAIFDVSTPTAMKLEGFVPTGSSPSGVLAAGGRVYVTNAGDDSIAVVDPVGKKVANRIALSIPGLEELHGVIPLGMAYDAKSGWLLVAEAGINAVGVVDTRSMRVLGHIPAAWYPTRVAINNGEVLVTNARGHGIGPDAPSARMSRAALSPPNLFQGTLSIFPMPAVGDLAALTQIVMRVNGFAPKRAAAPAPPPVKHVVLIVKEGRTYDEVLGDLHETQSGPAMGAGAVARYGLTGSVDGGHDRLSLKGVRVTPNTHAIATQWAFSDNFYADGDGTVDGHHWLTGAYPNGWTASSVFAAYGNLKDFRIGSAPGRFAFAGMASSVLPEDVAVGATLWEHLAKHRTTFYNFGEGLDLPGLSKQRYLTTIPIPEALAAHTSREYPGLTLDISDQDRASAFISEIDEKFAKTDEDLPQFLYVCLPGDAGGAVKPDDGYPYKESYVADNDLALGRIIEYLSASKWWNDMAVFVTESSAVGGIDHISANRTLLLAAGPWTKPGYVSHANTSFPGLLKTIFWLLKLPSLNLFDASAADLKDCFASAPTAGKFQVQPVDKRIFDPQRTH